MRQPLDIFLQAVAEAAREAQEDSAIYSAEGLGYALSVWRQSEGVSMRALAAWVYGTTARTAPIALFEKGRGYPLPLLFLADYLDLPGAVDCLPTDPSTDNQERDRFERALDIHAKRLARLAETTNHGSAARTVRLCHSDVYCVYDPESEEDWVLSPEQLAAALARYGYGHAPYRSRGWDVRIVPVGMWQRACQSLGNPWEWLTRDPAPCFSGLLFSFRC